MPYNSTLVYIIYKFHKMYFSSFFFCHLLGYGLQVFAIPSNTVQATWPSQFYTKQCMKASFYSIPHQHSILWVLTRGWMEMLSHCFQLRLSNFQPNIFHRHIMISTPFIMNCLFRPLAYFTIGMFISFCNWFLSIYKFWQYIYYKCFLFVFGLAFIFFIVQHSTPSKKYGQM